MNFLDDLGQEDVQQKKRRGKKLIVVDPAAAERYTSAGHHNRCDGDESLSTSSNVIAGP
jgi:hypothetical protein